MKESNETPRITNSEKELFEHLMPEDVEEILDTGFDRRHFLKFMALLGGGMLAFQSAAAEQMLTRSFTQPTPAFNPATIENGVEVAFNVNGASQKLTVDSRMSLLDTLRERLQLTGTKKGCDHGQCGACTVIVDGRRVLSCLTLAATCEGQTVKTIEGIAQGNQLHPMQAAFLKHDGFQCGFCTSGQICSAVALMEEAKAGELSYVTENIRLSSGTKATPVSLSDEEIRERMSGNLCRCGAYPNIVAAIQEAHSGKPVEQTWQFVG